MLAPNIIPEAEQQLAALAERIRDEHQAVQRAFANALAHALNVGDALIEAKGRVTMGWGRWLRKNCSMGESTARLFVQLAHHRPVIESEMSRVPGLSLRAARRLIVTPKSKSGRPEGQRQAAVGKLERTVTAALRQALSLQKGAPEGVAAPGIANALNGILSRLQSAGLTLHEISIEIRKPKSARRAA